MALLILPVLTHNLLRRAMISPNAICNAREAETEKGNPPPKIGRSYPPIHQVRLSIQIDLISSTLSRHWHQQLDHQSPIYCHFFTKFTPIWLDLIIRSALHKFHFVEASSTISKGKLFSSEPSTLGTQVCVSSCPSSCQYKLSPCVSVSPLRESLLCQPSGFLEQNWRCRPKSPFHWCCHPSLCLQI